MPATIAAQIEDQRLELSGQAFASGSFGYHRCGKLSVEIGGQTRTMMYQISCAVLNDQAEEQ